MAKKTIRVRGCVTCGGATTLRTGTSKTGRIFEVGDKLKQLYRLVEGGVAEFDDILRDRIASLRADRERNPCGA